MPKLESRYLTDLKNVVYDKTWFKTAKNFKVYSISRGIKTVNGLRYDQTLIFPKMLGKEFPKTKGHDHPKECGEWLTVVKGKAIFLLQNAKGKMVKDVYFSRAKAGEWVFSPKDFGHVTINSTRKPLKIATLIDSKCEGTYKEIEKLQGACYYYTTNGWIKNKNYSFPRRQDGGSKIPKLREEKPGKKPIF